MTRGSGLRCSLTTALVLCVTSVALNAHAEVTPFYTRNLHPFIQIFGLPPLESGMLAREGVVDTRLVLDLVNNSVQGSSGNEEVVIDGETDRLALVMRYRWRPDIELGVDLPFVHHTSGVFDNFIEDWHDTFGLSNGERHQFQSNTLNYRYAQNGVERVHITQAENGIGDVRLSAGYRLRDDDGALPRAVALRAGLKLPTGDPDQLLGSGGIDASLGVHFSDSRLMGRPDWTLFGGTGIVALGNGDVLPDLHRDLVGTANLGAGWHAWRIIDLKAQLNTHTAIYRSEVPELGSSAIELIVGGNIAFGEFILDIGVTENLFSDATPDVVFHFLLRHAR